MIDIINYINTNIQHIYFILSALAVLYTLFNVLLTFSKTVRSYFTGSSFLSSLKLVFNMPEKLDHIKNLQSDMYCQIQLQNKISNCILDNIDIAQMICDSEGRCIKVNSKWTSMTGLGESECLGHNWLLAISTPEEREYIKNKWNDMIENNTPFEETFSYQNRISNQTTKVKCTASDILDEKKSRIYILALSKIVAVNF